MFEFVIPNLLLWNEKNVWDCICTFYKEEDIEKVLKNFLMFGNKNIKMMEL